MEQEAVFEETRNRDIQPIGPRETYIWQDKKERIHRPMDFYLPEVMRQLESNQVVIVEAETGVGKTTRIPQAILDSDPQANIIMTQPTRLAVRMNGRFIAYEMGGKPGETVGWRLRGEPAQVTSDTRLTLMVDQSLINRIRHDQKLPEGILIVDEAHRRTVEGDMALALINEYLPSSPNTKLIVTSATIDTEKFREFFGAKEPVRAFNEQLYPVEVKPLRLGKWEHHTQGAIRAAKNEVLDAFAKGELTIPADKVNTGERQQVTHGSVLVLLPGKEDIQQTVREITAYAQKLGIADKVEVLECHGQMDAEEQKRIEQPVPAGTLRFICATEIIRSSVTAPQTVGVIDSLQVKRHFVDKNGVSHLGKVTIAGAEADQGKGRAGRERAGFYIPVSFEREYEHITQRQNSEYWPQPAIEREALSSVVLQFASVDLNIRTLKMLDKPPAEKIEVAIARLQHLGALDEHEKITDLGIKLVEFPIEPERAVVLLEAEKRGVLSEAIISMAVLENEGILYVPKSDANSAVVDHTVLIQILRQSENQREFWQNSTNIEKTDEEILKVLPRWVKQREDGMFTLDVQNYEFPLREGSRGVAALQWKQFAGDSNSDFYASVQAYRAFSATQKHLRREWCMGHSLNFKKMEFVEKTVADLRDEVREAGMKLENGITHIRGFDSADLTKSLLAGLVDSISKRLNSSNEYTGPKASAITKSQMSACQGYPEFALTEGVRKAEVGRRKNIVYFTDMIAQIEAKWIFEVIPQLCKASLVKSSAGYNPSRDLVEITEQTHLDNLLLKEEQVAAPLDMAVEQFASALTNNRVDLPFINHNNQVLAILEDLYTRSGGAIDAPPTTQQIIERYKDRLQNITSRQELEQALAGGKIDLELKLEEYVAPATKEQIIRNNPDNLLVGDRTYSINYLSNGWGPDKFSARIRVPATQIFTFFEIPRISSGRAITLEIADSETSTWKEFEGKDLKELKQRAKAYLIKKQWDNWRYTQPAETRQQVLPNFDLSGELPIMPERVAYGTDSETGELLYACPAITAESSYYAGNTFAIRYYSTAEEANQAQAKFDKLRDEALEKQRREQEQQTLLPIVRELQTKVRAQMDEVAEDSTAHGLSWSEWYEIRQQFERASYEVPSDPKKAQETLQHIKQQIDQAIQAKAVQERARIEQEEERARVAAEKQREKEKSGSQYGSRRERIKFAEQQQEAGPQESALAMALQEAGVQVSAGAIPVFTKANEQPEARKEQISPVSLWTEVSALPTEILVEDLEKKSTRRNPQRAHTITAVLASRGIEGARALGEDRSRILQGKERIDKVLAAAQEAEASDEQLIALRNKKKDIDVLHKTLEGSDKQIVKDFIGNDTDALIAFKKALYQELENKEELPQTDEELELVIEQILDKMTS